MMRREMPVFKAICFNVFEVVRFVATYQQRILPCAATGHLLSVICWNVGGRRAELCRSIVSTRFSLHGAASIFSSDWRSFLALANTLRDMLPSFRGRRPQHVDAVSFRVGIGTVEHVHD